MWVEAHLNNIPSGVILVSPAEPVEDLKNLLVLEDAEEPIQQDLQPDRDGLGTV